MRPQSSSGRPISWPITFDGSPDVTSCTNSTSPCSAASAIRSRQMRADLRLEVGDDLALEAVGQRPAVLDVARRVHRQQHVPHHLEVGLVEVLEHHPALAGGVEVRLAGDA